MEIFLLQTNGGAAGQELKYSWARDIPTIVAARVIEEFRNDYNIIHIRRDDQPSFDGTFSVTDNFRALAVLIELSEKRLFMDSFADHAAAAMNKPPTAEYKTMTLSKLSCLICSSVIAAADPNKASATTIGPIEVPNELIPPPKLTRLVPVDGSPNAMAKGCAAVCCNENPSATINRPTNIPVKVLAFTAMIIAAAPMAENSKPYTILFL